jgi:hypothetical protein
VLNIQGLDKLTDDGLAHIAANCTGLRDLDMQSCSPKITEKGIKELVQSASELRRLILKFCWPVDDSVLGAIGYSLGESSSLPPRRGNACADKPFMGTYVQDGTWRWWSFKAVPQSRSPMLA